MENVIVLSVILSVNQIQVPLSYHRLFEDAYLTQLSTPSPEFSPFVVLVLAAREEEVSNYMSCKKPSKAGLSNFYLPVH